MPVRYLGLIGLLGQRLANGDFCMTCEYALLPNDTYTWRTSFLRFAFFMLFCDGRKIAYEHLNH